MSKAFPLIILFYLISAISVAQQQQLVGIVHTSEKPIEGVHIINKSSKVATTSNDKGEFKLLAQPNDTLYISAIGFKKINRVIYAFDLKSSNFQIKLEEDAIVLNEVELIHYNKINAVDLGIISKNMKQYTPAEKRLSTLNSGLVEGIYNQLNGNVKRAKKMIEYEQTDFLIDDIKNLFDTHHFTNNLKIPLDYINGFLLFCTDDEQFCTLAKDKNKTLINFLLYEKSVLYLPLIKTD